MTMTQIGIRREDDETTLKNLYFNDEDDLTYHKRKSNNFDIKLD